MLIKVVFYFTCGMETCVCVCVRERERERERESVCVCVRRRCGDSRQAKQARNVTSLLSRGAWR
jgi:hypothetical protein